MDVGDGQSAQAIAEELSSPPSSLSDLSPQRSNPPSNHATSRDALVFGVSQAASKLSAAAPQPASATPASAFDEKPKRNSRAPVVLPDGTVRERKKPGPKPKPKDPNAPEKPKRKRQKVSDGPTSAPTPPPAQPAIAPPPQETPQYHQPAAPPPQQPSGPRQSKITDLVNPMPTTSQPRAVSEVYHGHHSPAQPQQVSHLNSTPATPRPASSGQVFDPIRGEVSSRMSNPSYSPTANHQHPQSSRFAPSTSATSAPVSPGPAMAKSSTTTYLAPQHSSTLVPQRSSVIVTAPTSAAADSTDAMDIDRAAVAPKVELGSAGPSSNAPTPPPQKQRAKEQPPPLPTGSGLLSGTPFGGIGAASANGNGTTGTNIWLTFSLKGQQNVTINFAREVEKRYGFAALHPRLAARKERQRQLAAASNALEKAAGLGSADEMSLDMSEPDSGNEGDAGGDDGSNAQGGDGTKKRRKRKAEDYDRNDDFIDDTEMAWEESALMARDGFFVYSGPLLAENEKPTIERADGTTKRGRGRGRGGAARGDGTSGRGSRGGATGGGRGSRGGTTVRKPRVTKADRAQMELEKAERERKGASLATKATPQHATQPPPPPTLPSQTPYAAATPALGA